MTTLMVCGLGLTFHLCFFRVLIIIFFFRMCLLQYFSDFFGSIGQNGRTITLKLIQLQLLKWVLVAYRGLVSVTSGVKSHSHWLTPSSMKRQETKFSFSMCFQSPYFILIIWFLPVFNLTVLLFLHSSCWRLLNLKELAILLKMQWCQGTCFCYK